jgi:hypothetical protein
VRHGLGNAQPATVRRLPSHGDAQRPRRESRNQDDSHHNEEADDEADDEAGARFVVDLDGVDGGLASGQYAAFYDVAAEACRVKDHASGRTGENLGDDRMDDHVSTDAAHGDSRSWEGARAEGPLLLRGDSPSGGAAGRLCDVCLGSGIMVVDAQASGPHWQ